MEIKQLFFTTTIFALSSTVIADQGHTNSTAKQKENLPQELSIAGLKIGMSPTEVFMEMEKREMTENGNRELMLSFQQRVESAKTGKGATPTAIGALKFRKGDQYIIAKFQPFKENPRLDLVIYSSRILNNDCNAFFHTLEERYGVAQSRFGSKVWEKQEPNINNKNPTTISLKASCPGGSLSLQRFGTNTEVDDAIKAEIGAVPRDF